jgi:hypothetical protein
MSALGGGLTFARLVDVDLTAAAFPVDLRVGRLGRHVPMELRISPWWEPRGGSLIELLPARYIAGTQAYFDAGNRLLDKVVEALTAPAVVESQPPVRTFGTNVA